MRKCGQQRNQSTLNETELSERTAETVQFAQHIKLLFVNIYIIDQWSARHIVCVHQSQTELRRENSVELFQPLDSLASVLYTVFVLLNEKYQSGS